MLTREELFGDLPVTWNETIYKCRLCGALTTGPDIHVMWHNTLDRSK
jgi:hypothetical protein